MNKLLLIVFLLSISFSVEAQRSSKYQRLRKNANSNLEKALQQPDSVESLDLTAYFRVYNRIPKEVFRFSNLKELAIGGTVRMHINFRDRPNELVFNKSKLSRLPNWFVDDFSVDILNLIGNPHLNKPRNLKKLSRMKGLYKLEITPEVIDAQFIKSIANFNHLKVLRLQDHYVLKASELKKLQEVLPNCEIQYFYFFDDLSKADD